MKPPFSSRRRLALLMAILFLVLVACERPLQDEDELPTEVPPPVGSPSVPIVVPSPLPLAPTDAAYPAPLPTLPAGDQPAPSPDQPAAADQPAQPSQPVTYLVQAGDTLARIAQQYNVSVEELAQANNLTNVNVLEVGQSLIIPVAGSAPVADQPAGEQVHVVQAGENLYRIALRYGLTYEELAAYNGIANPNRIDVGQAIRIPPTAN